MKITKRELLNAIFELFKDRLYIVECDIELSGLKEIEIFEICSERQLLRIEHDQDSSKVTIVGQGESVTPEENKELQALAMNYSNTPPEEKEADTTNLYTYIFKENKMITAEEARLKLQCIKSGVSEKYNIDFDYEADSNTSSEVYDNLIKEHLDAGKNSLSRLIEYINIGEMIAKSDVYLLQRYGYEAHYILNKDGTAFVHINW